MILEVRGPDGRVVWKAPEPSRARRRSRRRPRSSSPTSSPATRTRPRTRSGRPSWRSATARAASRRPAAVKTGTANDARDLATYGFLAPPGRRAPAGARGRRVDGQQRPLEPAVEAAGHLADRRRAAVARLRPRLHQGLAGHHVPARPRAWSARRSTRGRAASPVRGRARRRRAGSSRDPARRARMRSTTHGPAVRRGLRRLAGRSRSRPSSGRRAGTPTSPTGCGEPGAGPAGPAGTTRGPPTSGDARPGAARSPVPAARGGVTVAVIRANRRSRITTGHQSRPSPTTRHRRHRRPRRWHQRHAVESEGRRRQDARADRLRVAVRLHGCHETARTRLNTPYGD